MTTETPAPAPPQRPKLEICLGIYIAIGEQLTALSGRYQQAKRMLLALRTGASLDGLPDIVAKLGIGGLDVPVQMPPDSHVFVGMLEDAVASLGEQVIALWDGAYDNVVVAHDHCVAAKAQAQADQQTPTA